MSSISLRDREDVRPLRPPPDRGRLHRACAGADVRGARLREEDARELDPKLVAGMHAAGLFRMLLPRWLNGGALDTLAYTRVVEEIRQARCQRRLVRQSGIGLLDGGGLSRP